MSVIYDAVLLMDDEKKAVTELNRQLRLTDTAREQQFERIDTYHAGGTKSFTRDIYAAAFNHLSPSTVEDAICHAPWSNPGKVIYVRDLMDYDGDWPMKGLESFTVAQLRELS